MISGWRHLCSPSWQEHNFDERIPMYKGMYVAVTGALSAQKKLDTIANNLANINTAGFKGDRLIFESYLSKSDKGVGASTAGPGELAVGNMRHAEYVVTDQGYSDFSQGAIRVTGNPMDAAINGKGFFSVMTYSGERYSRSGEFSIGPTGELTLGEGNLVLSDQDQPIHVSDGMVHIDEEGNVWVKGGATLPVGGDGSSMNSVHGLHVGRLKMVDLKEPYSLSKEGNGMYRADNPEDVFMAQNVSIKQGALESSNVNMIGEMTQMIKGQRLFDTFQKAIQANDQMTTQLILQVGKP